MNSKHVLIATLFSLVYFLLLFFNGEYALVRTDSYFTIVTELVTIPIALLTLLINIYSIANLFRTKEDFGMTFASFIISLLVIGGMFVVK